MEKIINEFKDVLPGKLLDELKAKIPPKTAVSKVREIMAEVVKEYKDTSVEPVFIILVIVILWILITKVT